MDLESFGYVVQPPKDGADQQNIDVEEPVNDPVVLDPDPEEPEIDTDTERNPDDSVHEVNSGSDEVAAEPEILVDKRVEWSFRNKFFNLYFYLTSKEK